MIEKLVERIKKLEAPIVVGLDPTLNFVPGFLLDKAINEKGETLEAAADAIFEFNKKIVDAVYDLIPAVKPQIAMYEQFGIPGLMAYKQTVDYCHEKGLLVIGDAKRGDIGSTSTAYAIGHIGTVKIGSTEIAPIDTDFLTINPYMGSDSVVPFVEECKKYDKGLFILVKTSNPSSGEFQDQKVGKEAVYELVGKKVDEWGAELVKNGYSDVGAVVGATYPEMGEVLREIMPKAYILVPGYGAQGGTAAELKPFFNKDGLGAIVNSSRGIIAAYTQDKYGEYGAEGFAEAARAAVIDMKNDIASIF